VGIGRARAVVEPSGLSMMPVIRLPRPWHGANSVDEWGRDAQLIAILSPLARLRWNITVGGADHLPKRNGALLVTNSRHLSLTTVYTAWALSQATGRAVRFSGRPELAPAGPLMQRLGGILGDPDEVRGALRAGELVVASAHGTANPRHAGSVDHDIVAAAVLTSSPIFPVASMSSFFGRATRVEVGAVIRSSRKRRGPLAEIELAETTQRHIQRILDSLGGLHTGVAPIDWLAEG
jgi:hypothetical protein